MDSMKLLKQTACEAVCNYIYQHYYTILVFSLVLVWILCVGLLQVCAKFGTQLFIWKGMLELGASFCEMEQKKIGPVGRSPE